MSLGRLEGKTAMVSGGGSGIGRAVCQVFAREGANVAVLDINLEGAEETLISLPRNHGNAHCVIHADVSKSSDVKRAFESAEIKLGKKCNILVNNAGVARLDFLDEMSENNFDDIIRVNLKGPFLMAKKFVTSLNDVNDEFRGAMVNVSSRVAKVAIPGYSAYIASKSGLLGLTTTIAKEFPRHRVRCNAVLPGLVDTPLLERAPAIFKKKMKDVIKKPEEVAKVCLFLASDESSAVNGACLELSQ